MDVLGCVSLNALVVRLLYEVFEVGWYEKWALTWPRAAPTLDERSIDTSDHLCVAVLNDFGDGQPALACRSHVLKHPHRQVSRCLEQTLFSELVVPASTPCPGDGFEMASVSFLRGPA